MVNWNWGLRWGHLKRSGGGRHSLVSISSFSSFGPSELPITWEWNAIYEFPGRRNQLQRINMSSKTSNSNKMTKFFISMGPHTFWCFFLEEISIFGNFHLRGVCCTPQEQFFQKWWTLLLISRNHLESIKSFGAHVLRKTPMKRYMNWSHVSWNCVILYRCYVVKT